jgi:hypothetical protein
MFLSIPELALQYIVQSTFQYVAVWLFPAKVCDVPLGTPSGTHSLD